MNGFGYLNDNLRVRAKLGGYYEYRPQYGFWTNVALSGRIERDSSISAYFWRYSGMDNFRPDSEMDFGYGWGKGFENEWNADSGAMRIDSVRVRYYLGKNVKIGPELRLQMGYRFNSIFSLDFLGNLYYSYNPYEDEWISFDDQQNSTWNRQILQGSLRLRGNMRGKHFGTYLSVGTYFRRYFGLPSGHPEIYSYADFLSEIRLGMTFRY